MTSSPKRDPRAILTSLLDAARQAGADARRDPEHGAGASLRVLRAAGQAKSAAAAGATDAGRCAMTNAEIAKRIAANVGQLRQIASATPDETARAELQLIVADLQALIGELQPCAE